MLWTDSLCTILIIFVLLTYNGSATSRKVAVSIPDGATVIFQILCADPSDRWLVVSWTTTKWTINARLYKPATELPDLKMPNVTECPPETLTHWQ